MKGFLLVIILLLFLVFPTPLFAHSGGGLVGEYIIKFTEEPLSPVVGEQSSITINVMNKEGKPVTGLKGNVLVKELHVHEYVGHDAEQEYEEIYRKEATTDSDGNVAVNYTFPKQAYYGVEFAWGATHETETTEKMYHPLLLNQVAKDPIKDISLYMISGFVGLVVGAFGAFILLTSTLRRKN